MRFSTGAAVTSALALSTQTSALNILLGNDDGFGSAHIRETYRLLKKVGHNVVLVASADNESGQGGRSVFTTSPKLEVDSEYGLIKAGAPSIGTDPNDSMIWYYNGTPAACMFVALDYVLPKIGWDSPPDLVVAGPNFGLNLGPFLYTLSGTAGYTYGAVGRGIPAIAFSGGNSEQRSYQWINKTTPSGHPDPATIQAQMAVNLVQNLVKHTPKGHPILPQGYGLNVNVPMITSLTNDSCVNPPFIQARLNGAALSDVAVYNETSKTFKYGPYVPKKGSGLNRCINGDCSLPDETDVLSAGCQSSVSVFTVDYDAPVGSDLADIDTRLKPLVKETSDGKGHPKGWGPPHHWGPPGYGPTHHGPPHHGPPHDWSARYQL